VQTRALEQGSLEGLADALNKAISAETSFPEVTASVHSSGNLILTWAEYREVDHTAALSKLTEPVPYAQAITDEVFKQEDIFRGQVHLESTQRITASYENQGPAEGSVFGAELQADSGQQAKVLFQNPEQDGYLYTSDILTANRAQKAIQRIDLAVEDVNSFRATLGAKQNRFESAINNLTDASESLTQARSRIMDADIAKEAAKLTQNEVRRQAASSVLAQANQNPQIALQLLGQG
jgi:flagellin